MLTALYKISLTEESLDVTNDSEQNHAVNFDFNVQGKEFDKILVTTVIKDASKKSGTRTRTRLSKGIFFYTCYLKKKTRYLHDSFVYTM